MAAPPPTERLRISTRSAVIAVSLFGATLALIRLVLAAQRVLGWILAAAAVAGLLEPFVGRLRRRLPHGVAVAIVAIATLAVVGFVTYSTVDGIVQQTDALKEAAPKRAAELEESKRFGDFAREIDLAERTERLVEEVPAKLRGGSPSEALRAATTRGVAFLAAGVLTLFFLLHGPRIAAAAARQIHDDDRRAKLERVALAAFHRGFGYARGSLGMAIAAGLLGFSLARAVDVPGAAPLGLWVALWDLVPLLGVVLGALPIIVLAGIDAPSKAVMVAGVFVGYQILEAVLLQRPLHNRTVKVGPFLTVAGGGIGLELYGIAGALLMLLAISIALAVGDELAPESGAAADGGEVG